eukprot:COSAG04_NODE_20664_length_389_cov_0.527586_1_plen_52_part_10
MRSKRQTQEDENAAGAGGSGSAIVASPQNPLRVCLNLAAEPSKLSLGHRKLA